MYRITLLAAFITMLTVEPMTSSSAAPAAGDARRGERLFGTLPCVSCHDVTKPWPGGDICPNLGNIATEAARLVRSHEYRGKAKTAAEYIRESIVDPNGFNNLVGWELTRRWGVEHVVLPSRQMPDAAAIALITDADADAYVLGASPASVMRAVSRSRSGRSGLSMNGTMLKRRRAASSTLCSTGLWLPTIISLNCGLN